MEILDALERRVSNLLDEVTTLRAENFRLQKLLAESKAQAAARKASETPEVQALQKELAEGEALRENILKRIDALVKRLEENSK